MIYVMKQQIIQLCKSLILIQSVFITLAATTAWAWPPTYGAEFEITSKNIKHYDFKNNDPSLSTAKAEQIRYVTAMREHCKITKCIITEVIGKFDTDYKVEYTDGWWFKISYDPGCVEITFKPSTLSDLNQRAQFINQEIFKVATDHNFYVREKDTSHFNIGIRSAFNDSAKEFMKFFVDYANHADLALGSLGYDINNAPPLSVLGLDQRQALQKIVNDVNSGKVKTIAQAARAIENTVYTKSYKAEWGGKNHYQAVGLKYVNKTDLTKKDAPMELRAVWIQKNAQQFNLIAKLIEGRINYLKTVNSPIIYTATERTDYTFSELHTRFAMYVTESGLKYSDYTDLLPEFIRSVPFENFYHPRASLDQKLMNAKSYMDLLPASELVQKEMIELLSNQDIEHHPESIRLMEEIKFKSSKNIKKNSFMNSTIKYFSHFINRTVDIPVSDHSVDHSSVYKKILDLIDLKKHERSENITILNKKNYHGQACKALF